MPFPAPEGSGAAPFSVWAWWWSCWRCLQISLLLSFGLPKALVNFFGDAELQRHHLGLFLGFTTHLFNVCTFLQAQPLARLLLHAGLFSPALHLLLCLFLFFLHFLALSFYNWSIWTNSFYSLLLELFLKKARPFLFLLYHFKERKAHTTFEDKNTKFENNAEHNAFYPHCVGRKEVNRSPVLHSTFEEYQG